MEFNKYNINADASVEELEKCRNLLLEGVDYVNSLPCNPEDLKNHLEKTNKLIERIELSIELKK